LSVFAERFLDRDAAIEKPERHILVEIKTMQSGRMTVNELEIRQDFEILASGLDVLFVGINPPPGAVAAGGHSYANPTNRFWRVLFAAGFTDVVLRPHEERRLLDFKIGSTAVVLRPTRTAAEVAVSEFRDARPDLEAKVSPFAPRVVAFLGKRAYSSMMRKTNVTWGK